MINVRSVDVSNANITLRFDAQRKADMYTVSVLTVDKFLNQYNSANTHPFNGE